MIQSAQVERLTDEHVPEQQRGWVGTALLLPINRVLDLFRTLLNRGISVRAHVNAQVVERNFTAPSGTDWSSARLDTPLNIAGPVLGIQVLACYTTDSAGHDTGTVAGLSLPQWLETLANGKRTLRLIYQPGLLDGVRYRLVLIVWGQ